MSATVNNSHPLKARLGTFGTALAMLRAERGMSHRDVANGVGADKRVVREWERDQGMPDTIQLKRLTGLFRQLPHYTHLMRALPKQANGVAWEQPAVEPKDLPVSATAPKMPRQFPAALRAVRLAEGLDQSELAELIGVHHTTVSGWEMSKSRPIVEIFDKLMDLLPALKECPRPRDLRTYAPGTRPGRGGNKPAPASETAEPPQPAPPAPAATPVPATPVDMASAGMAYAQAIVRVNTLNVRINALKGEMATARDALTEAGRARDEAHRALLEAAKAGT